ncbi:MAG: YkvA family protein [Saprospiraceae bacterium]
MKLQTIKTNRLVRSLSKIARRAGSVLIYRALMLFYLLQRPNVPTWIKTTLLGAIAYLLSPIDAIPDLTPVLGFTDDLSVITLALVVAQAYVDEDLKSKASLQTISWLGPIDVLDVNELAENN